MALPSGLAAQLGTKAETTWGTAVTVNRFTPLVSESLTADIDRLVSEGIIAGRTIADTDQVVGGNVSVAGDIEIECYQQSIGHFLYHALGSVSSTTASSPYTHTITPGTLTGLGLTAQIGRPDTGGTVRAFTYAGLKVDSLSLKVAAGEIATMGIGVVGRSVATNTSLEVASYAGQAATPFTGINATTTTWNGALNVKAYELQIENKLDRDRRFLGSSLISEPLQADHRDITGMAQVEFSSLALYEDFISLTHRDLVVTMTNGSELITITSYARFDEFAPKVDGKGLLVVDVPFTVAGDGSDADALTVLYKSADTSVTN